MTPRERDPQVWAAAYSDFFNRALAAAYSAADGGPDERMAAAIAAVDVERCKLVADAAVMALHPDEQRHACSTCGYEYRGNTPPPRCPNDGAELRLDPS